MITQEDKEECHALEVLRITGLLNEMEKAVEYTFYKRPISDEDYEFYGPIR